MKHLRSLWGIVQGIVWGFEWVEILDLTNAQVFGCEEYSDTSLLWSKYKTSERKCLQWTKQPIINQYQCIKWIDFYPEQNCFFRKTYFYENYHILSCCVKMWYLKVWNKFGEIGEKMINWPWYDMIHTACTVNDVLGL